MRKKFIRLAFISAVIPVLAFAAQDWAWNTQSGYTGQVDLGTSGSVASLSTMTSGSANIAGNGAVQPPLVVNVQAGATASLPIKNIGDACTSTTSGTAPNQTADEGTAITADRSSLLTCQSGSWKAGVISVGYWKFKIPGDPYNMYHLGSGIYDNALNTFTGELKCDYVTVSAIYGSAWANACGHSGSTYCGSDQNCAFTSSFSGNGPPTYNSYFIVQVKNLIVSSASNF